MKYLDTRDLYKRQQELQGELDNLIEDRNDAEDAEDAEELAYAEKELQDWIEEYQDELDELNALETEIGYEWQYGETLIPDSELENYVEEFCYDVGYLEKDSWLASYIDWEAVARDFKMDYSYVDFEGETYWYRMS